MTTLNGTIPFPQVYDISSSISNNLDFNVTGAIDKSFDKDGAVTETGQGFTRGGFEKGNEVFHVANDTHTLATSTHGSL
jgi:hypothetical protein